jgi:hypothetical protein
MVDALSVAWLRVEDEFDRGAVEMEDDPAALADLTEVVAQDVCDVGSIRELPLAARLSADALSGLDPAAYGRDERILGVCESRNGSRSRNRDCV